MNPPIHALFYFFGLSLFINIKTAATNPTTTRTKIPIMIIPFVHETNEILCNCDVIFEIFIKNN